MERSLVHASLIANSPYLTTPSQVCYTGVREIKFRSEWRGQNMPGVGRRRYGHTHGDVERYRCARPIFFANPVFRWTPGKRPEHNFSSGMAGHFRTQ